MHKPAYNLRQTYLQPAFLICAAVLAISGGGMSIAKKKFEMYLKKYLDENRLAPYEVVLKKKIENEEVLKSLGTKDYIQWILRDRDEPPNSPVHQYLLFITYYQLPDRVPHVPEECYTGGGYQRSRQFREHILSFPIKTPIIGSRALQNSLSCTFLESTGYTSIVEERQGQHLTRTFSESIRIFVKSNWFLTSKAPHQAKKRRFRPAKSCCV
jgi:hypothetical protein